MGLLWSGGVHRTHDLGREVRARACAHRRSSRSHPVCGSDHLAGSRAHRRVCPVADHRPGSRILYLIVQQLENNVLVPKVMQKVTGLNPIISILALLVGLKAGGLAGAILSIPLAMMGVVILEDLFRDVTE